MPDNLRRKLAERSKLDNKRTLSLVGNKIDFVSNDYLGLSRSRELFDRISQYSYDGIVNLNGSSGSRLLAGNSVQAVALEQKLSDIFHSNSSLLFNSGYAANLALISSVPQKGDTILYDSLSHVCLKEGAWLSKAESMAFRHNDVDDLEQKIKRSSGAVFVVIESVYSMDGDRAPIQEIIALKKLYEIHIIVDEAHSTGVFGDRGSGLVCDMGLEKEFFARVYTFGKAMGVHGACVCGSETLTDYLINFGRSFIYTTALPVHSIFSIDAAFDFLKEHMHLQKDIATRIAYFNDCYHDMFGDMSDINKPMSSTPIQPIIISGNSRIKNIADQLQKAGYDIRPILAPTVRAGAERLRISLHAHNSMDEIHQMLNDLKRFFASKN